jgi:A/G-specific adenine glycosylase
MTTPLASRLLSWYARHARRLPWRNHPDPYVVWVSEIMLQQTRVETVIPYFERWLKRFPDIQTLAAADQQDVLNLWEGLGYYSRARNLHKAAQIVVNNHAGQLPQEPGELQALPGIGRYTAGAIASLAFGKDTAALDGNIRRVLARVFNLEIPARSPEGERQLWALAEEHLPPGRAGDYNQALMDLGAVICTVRSPDCPNCPLHELCAAYALELQEQRPVRKPAAQTPHYTVTAAVLRADGRVLIARRPEDGLLGGMWEFPGGKCLPGETLPACLQREIQEELAAEILVGPEIGAYQHAFTHFRITLHAFECRLRNGSRLSPQEHSAVRWVRPAELQDFPMGKVDRQIADKLAAQVPIRVAK